MMLADKTRRGKAKGRTLLSYRFMSFLKRAERRPPKQAPVFRKRLGDSFDLIEVGFLKAAYESAEMWGERFLTCKAYDTEFDLMTVEASLANPSGLFMEFGVASGRTINHLASLVKEPVYGFDPFDGLPENWRTGFEKSSFADVVPPVISNVSLIKGWFSETLPPFLSQHSGCVSFLHVDCDLCTSTKCILDLLGDRITKGTVIQFDEYWNYPGRKPNEFLAFEEFMGAAGVSSTLIGFVSTHQQVVFVID